MLISGKRTGVESTAAYIQTPPGTAHLFYEKEGCRGPVLYMLCCLAWPLMSIRDSIMYTLSLKIDVIGGFLVRLSPAY